VTRDHDVARRAFEGLFHGDAKSLRDELRGELVSSGYDAAESRDGWPVQTWRRVLELVRQRSCPKLSQSEGFRDLGRRFARGFGETPVGWVFTAVAPLLGPERALMAVPKYLHVVRKNLAVELHAVDARRFQFIAKDALFSEAEPPDFLAGCLEQVLIATGETPRVKVASFDGVRLELDVAW